MCHGVSKLASPALRFQAQQVAAPQVPERAPVGRGEPRCTRRVRRAARIDCFSAANFQNDETTRAFGALAVAGSMLPNAQSHMAEMLPRACLLYKTRVGQYRTLPRLPPPVPIVSPLMATERGEARKATTYATSRASTMRPIEVVLAARCSVADSVRSVRVAPGCSATTLIPFGPSSSARFLVSAETPTLRIVAIGRPVPYAASPPILMIRPQPFLIKCGASARVVRK